MDGELAIIIYTIWTRTFFILTNHRGLLFTRFSILGWCPFGTLNASFISKSFDSARLMLHMLEQGTKEQSSQTSKFQ